MSRVIKNNDGVAVVEGTPAASLVKDVDKFFAAKPPERMAGESVSQPRKIDPRAINTKRPIDPRAINTRRPTPKDLEQMNNPPVQRDRILTGEIKDKDGNEIVGRKPTREEFNSFLEEQGFSKLGEKPLPPRPIIGPEPEPPQSERRDKETLKEYAARMGRPGPKKNESEDQPRIPRDSKPRRNEAKDRAAARRERFFERRRSRKEAERSQTEQEATQGKFITTLGR